MDARSVPTRRLVVAGIAAAVLAVVLRTPVLLRSGGLFSAATTDDGVHYAAAAALLAGRAPYRDFLFLHPPGILVAVLPFAALGRWIGDADAFAAARAAFIVLGAATTGLAVPALRRFGLGAAIVGGAAVAASYPVLYAERSVLLEPLGAAGLLGALALQAGSRTRGRRIAAGVLLGLAAVVKLPFVLPAVVIALAVRRGAGAVLLSAVGAAAAVCLPFLLVAGPAMVQQVVLDQAGRRRIVPALADRLRQMFPPPSWPGSAGALPLRVVLVAVVGLVVVGLVVPGARRFAVLLVVDGAELLAGPSFYGHYAILVALPAALLTGVLAGRLGALARGRRRRTAVVVGVGALALAAGLGAWNGERVGRLTTPPLPSSFIAAVRAVPGCTTADRATALVLAGAVSRDLERGCPLRPDVTGWQFAGGRLGGRSPLAQDDPAYQLGTLRYLRSGAAAALVTEKDGLSAATRAVVRSGPVLWSGDGGSLHAVVPSNAD